MNLPNCCVLTIDAEGRMHHEVTCPIRLAVDAEREACAKIAEGYAALHIESNPCHIQAKKTAAKIRARGSWTPKD